MIERIDNDGPYSPENCRWATRSEQMSNRRPFRRRTECRRGHPVNSVNTYTNPTNGSRTCRVCLKIKERHHHMSNTVKLSSALPGDEQNNGLDEYAPQLIAEPRTIVAAIVMLDVPKIVDDTESGTRLPYARIRRIEVLGPAKDVDPKFVQLFQKVVENRTGAPPLPFGEDFTVEEGDE